MDIDVTIEEAIQAKGLTAPRVTPADIEASIVSTYYFTAYEAVMAGWPPGSYAPPAADEDTLRCLTFCVLTLANGFTVTGESACVHPENFDVEIGRRIARKKAVDKVWPLLGFALQDRLLRGLDA